MAQNPKWSLAEFCETHGGRGVKMSDKLGYLTVATKDETCYLSFAKKQFPNMTIAEAKEVINTKDLEVMQCTSEAGKTCFIIVEATPFFETFNF